MMTISQMAVALDSLGKLTIGLTSEGRFYCSLHRVEIANGGTLTSATRFGGTPDEAVRNLFEWLTALPHDRWVVVDAYSIDGQRRAYCWSGFMWKPFVEPTQEARP